MSLIGQKIVDIREMTDKEVEQNFPMSPVRSNPPVLVLEDGTTLFASADHEGNGPGAIFGEDGDRQFFVNVSQTSQ